MSTAVEVSSDFDIRTAETKKMCPWCRGCGKRDVARNVNLKCTIRFQPVVCCEACRGEGLVSATEYQRLLKSASGTFTRPNVD